MLIELPLSSRDLDEAWLTTMDDALVWGLIDFDEGEVKRVEFYDSREDIEEMVDYAIVAKQGEPIWPMIEENIFVLVAREGASIDEVMEGFKFKELHEASF
ncbi:hypothetical protein [Hydrogenimonas thermophila]|uniref:Uncharacterized protein n=1 Tax=Hydrogenimonas thermophila TaxID=223786 RepID=A0A1I5L8D1_9BACT|nr:hypothetical protein [Hydrogenimonas thermophila]WOE70100.1 hypothetical protein RZR91_00605 [Hydrogenimonas thermophila]WOE72617.1 hypothetical protein RZR97_00605 [Hydrogenimonas thermophila]SFO93540.1 hypothetical protein SAMN05216234_10290 [Hydrogenimonas thermophila]